MNNINFSKINIFVIGDLMLDEYIIGNDYGMSDEAPVPILKVDEFKVCLGGAANVAHNIHSLGGTPIICGVIGGGVDKIRHGHSFTRFMHLCDKIKINSDNIVFYEGITTTKSRVIINEYQVARYDYEQNIDDAKVYQEIYDKIDSIDFSLIDAIIVSDYRKGVIDQKVMDILKSKNTLIIVDPKPGNESFYKNVDYITPNFKEFMLIIKETNKEYVESNLDNISREFIEQYSLAGLIITMGDKGAYYMDNNSYGYVETNSKEVVNLIGAGDTFVSAFTLSFCSSGSLMDSINFANRVAGIVISDKFTSVCYKKDVIKFSL